MQDWTVVIFVDLIDLLFWRIDAGPAARNDEYGITRRSAQWKCDWHCMKECAIFVVVELARIGL